MNASKNALLMGSLIVLAGCGRLVEMPGPSVDHPASPEAAAGSVRTLSILTEQPAAPVSAPAKAPRHHMHHEHDGHESHDGETHHEP